MIRLNHELNKSYLTGRLSSFRARFSLLKNRVVIHPTSGWRLICEADMIEKCPDDPWNLSKTKTHNFLNQRQTVSGKGKLKIRKNKTKDNHYQPLVREAWDKTWGITRELVSHWHCGKWQLQLPYNLLVHFRHRHTYKFCCFQEIYNFPRCLFIL